MLISFIFTYHIYLKYIYIVIVFNLFNLNYVFILF